MLKHYRSAAVAVSALLVASGLAYGAGNYLTYPIVGQPSFCASNVTGTGGFTIPQGNTGGAGATGQGQGVGGATVCAQTIPAGPPALTGGELIPMDTGAQIPATVTMSSTWLHAGYYQIATTGTTVTVAPGTQNLILNLGAATEAVTLPAAPYDNQLVLISNASTTAISTFSITANTGQTITQGAAPATLAAAASVSYVFNGKTSVWYRVT